MKIRILKDKIVHNLNKMSQKKLINESFSILAPTCIAGVIYHRLNKEFKSPTINLWMSENDFYLFVCDLKWYLSQEIMEADFPDEETPVGVLRGRKDEEIFIHFNHHKDFSKARDDWERRKLRVDYDNLFVVASTPGKETIEQVKRWEHVLPNIKGLVVFTAKNYKNIPYAKQLRAFRKQDGCGRYMVEGKTKLLGLFPWEKDFNYVKWLNTGKPK